MNKPSPITDLLRNSDFPAEGVLQRGQYLHRLNRLLASLLDDDSKVHCQVGNVRDGILIVYVDSTAWASRLRYQAPALLKQLQQRKGLATLQQIDFKVLPRQEKESRKIAAKMSSEASSCLSACAEAVSDDKLRSALQQLASRHKRPD